MKFISNGYLLFYIQQHSEISADEEPKKKKAIVSLMEYLWKSQDISFENDSEMKLLVFGRTLSPQDELAQNVYEIVLAYPGTKDLIELIWKCFNLKNHPEVFFWVSMALFALKLILTFSFYYFRETLPAKCLSTMRLNQSKFIICCIF